MERKEIVRVRPHIEIPPELQKKDKYCYIQNIVNSLKRKQCYKTSFSQTPFHKCNYFEKNY